LECGLKEAFDGLSKDCWSTAQWSGFGPGKDFPHFAPNAGRVDDDRVSEATSAHHSPMLFSPWGYQRRRSARAAEGREKSQQLFPTENTSCWSKTAFRGQPFARDDFARKLPPIRLALLPRMSHGAILTRGLCECVSLFGHADGCTHTGFASFASRLADGSAANPYRRRHAIALFLKVSRFRYCARQTPQIP